MYRVALQVAAGEAEPELLQKAQRTLTRMERRLVDLDRNYADAKTKAQGAVAGARGQSGKPLHGLSVCTTGPPCSCLLQYNIHLAFVKALQHVSDYKVPCMYLSSECTVCQARANQSYMAICDRCLGASSCQSAGKLTAAPQPAGSSGRRSDMPPPKASASSNISATASPNTDTEAAPQQGFWARLLGTPGRSPSNSSSVGPGSSSGASSEKGASQGKSGSANVSGTASRVSRAEAAASMAQARAPNKGKPFGVSRNTEDRASPARADTKVAVSAGRDGNEPSTDSLLGSANSLIAKSLRFTGMAAKVAAGVASAIKADADKYMAQLELEAEARVRTMALFCIRRG